MVARSPPQQKKMVAPLDPLLLRETINKVDKAIARLQELQFTVTGGEKVISGITLSPRSTRGYLRTSLKCKQETLRMKNANARRSPTGNLSKNTGDWKRMSLPAMLLGETVGEILQASQFARQIVEAVDPKTPLTHKRIQKPNPLENLELPARRRREKQVALQTIRSDSNPVYHQRAKSRISFRTSSSPIHKIECDKENCRYIANRVSPRNKPWVKKTVLFPNPLFHSSPTSSKQQTFCKNKSPPVIARRSTQTPHKFLVKSPHSSSKFHTKIRSPPLTISPTRSTILRKRSSLPKESAAAKFQRSFSPSRLATKLVSPLKSRKSLTKNDGIKMNMMMMSGLKQRSSPPRVSDVIHRSFSPTSSTVLRNRSSPPKASAAVKFRRSFSSTNSTILRKRSSPPKEGRPFSPTSSTILRKRSSPPKESAAAKFRRSFSPSRLVSKLASASPLKSRKSISKNDGMKHKSPPKVSAAVQMSFSPSILATKFVSPLKSRKSVPNNNDGMKMMMISGLKQRPSWTPMHMSASGQRL